jgi:hypothetical protein
LGIPPDSGEPSPTEFIQQPSSSFEATKRYPNNLDESVDNVDLPHDSGHQWIKIPETALFSSDKDLGPAKAPSDVQNSSTIEAQSEDLQKNVIILSQILEAMHALMGDRKQFQENVLEITSVLRCILSLSKGNLSLSKGNKKAQKSFEENVYGKLKKLWDRLWDMDDDMVSIVKRISGDEEQSDAKSESEDEAVDENVVVRHKPTYKFDWSLPYEGRRKVE